MNYEGHRNGGIVSAIGVGAVSLFLTFNPMIAVVCAITTLIMALYPDFDTASTPSKYSFIIGIPLIIILGAMHHIQQAVLLLCFIATPKMFPHRGLVHTIRFGILASVALYFIINPFIHIGILYILISGGIGYLTHLILDAHVRL